MTGSSHFGDLAGIGPAGGIVHFDQFAVGLGDFVAHAGRGGDELKAELAFQALLNDFHVEQAEKAAAKAETEGHGAFRLKEEGRIVEAQFFQGLAQLSVLVRIHGVEAGENHGLDFFKARQGLDGGIVRRR